MAGRARKKLTQGQREELLSQLEWDDSEFTVEVYYGPHSADPTGRWNIKVILGKRSVRLYQPKRGHIKLDTGKRTKNARPSTRTSDINVAIRRAEKFLLSARYRAVKGEAIDATVTVSRPDEVTIGLVNDLFRRDQRTRYRKKFWRNLLLVMDLVELRFGRGFPVLNIDQDFVAEFITWRHAEKQIIMPPSIESDRRRQIVLRPVSEVTALGNLKDYDHVLRYAHSLRRKDGTRLIPYNPLRELDRWPKYEKRLREAADDNLYELLMTPFSYTTEDGRSITLPAPVDVADQSGLGLVRTIVAVQYHTARRRTAVLNLRCGNIITSMPAIRRKLIELAGAHRKEWAEHFQYGVIEFEGRWDKNGYHRLFPMSKDLRAHLDAHLERLRTAGYSTDPGAPLFPRPGDPTRACSENTLYKVRSIEHRKRKDGRIVKTRKAGGWYTESLHIARDYLQLAGKDPDEVIPTDPKDPEAILNGFKAHAWRRWWATKLERLGYGKRTSTKEFDLDRHVNFMGSWSVLGGGIREERYVQLDPEILVAIANFSEASRFQERCGRFEERRTSEINNRVLAAIPHPGKQFPEIA